MKLLSRLADLEELVNQVPDPSIRAYSEEALTCYQAGAYRSSIVSLWIAIVFDLFQKITFIAQQHNDPAAKACLQQIDRMRADPDKKQAGKWEAELLEHAYERVKLLTSQEYTHLKRIQQDRHLCAHPALDRDEKLFQPSAELARIHLRTALETLLCQPALIGKATVEAIQREVNSAYFPTNPEGIAIVVDKLIPRASDNHIFNLFKFLLKHLLFIPTDASNAKEIDLETKYILVFKALFKKFHTVFLKMDRQTITPILDSTIETQYRVLSRLLATIPELHPYLSPLVIEKLKVALKQHNQEIVFITLPVFLEIAY